MTKVSNCGKDEYGGIRGGKAGDQSGGEWWIIDWYDFGQNVVLRHPDAKVRAKLAELATAAAKNDKIGYDQSQRLTFWEQLKKVGYNPAKIKVACEADCSSGVAAIVKATGIMLGNEAMAAVSPSSWTGNLRAQLVAAGFKALTDSKYLKSGNYLLAGDINLNESRHVNTTITNGSKSGTTPTTGGKLDVDGWLGELSVEEWQRQLGTPIDGVVSGQLKRNAKYFSHLTSVTYRGGGSQMVEAIQRKLGCEVDGIIGPETVRAIQRFVGTEADGYLGHDTACAIQRKLNAKGWQ